MKGTHKTVKLFKNFDDAEKELEKGAELSVESLKKFLAEFSFPLVFPWSDTASEKIYSDKKVGVILFRESNDKQSLAAITEVAKARKCKPRKRASGGLI